MMGMYLKRGTFSRSKVYGKADLTVLPSAKRPKYDKEMRADRLKSINDELSDIDRLLKFKEKRLSQAESSKSYKTCEQVTEEIMTLKSKATDLNREKRLFEKKADRAKRRMLRKKGVGTPSPEPRSDDTSRRSSKSSLSSSCGSSSSLLQSQLTAPKINEANNKDKQGLKMILLYVIQKPVVIQNFHLLLLVIQSRLFSNALLHFLYECRGA